MNLKFTKTFALMFLIGGMSVSNGFSQTKSTDDGENLVKLNLPSLAMKTLNV